MLLFMQLSIAPTKPFSFAQTFAFLRSFPPCQGDYVVSDESITAAVSVGGIARPFTLRAGDPLTLDVPRHVDAATQRALVARAADFVGAHDDVARFYAAAEGDAALAPVIRALHGLHHVRFLTLEEVVVYCVLAQRTPATIARVWKRRFLERFGIPIDVGGTTLRAMPELDQLVELDVADLAEAIGHTGKAERIAAVVHGTAVLGEDFLRTAPYAAARDALLDVPGIGPFSATMILLRGLGRMDDVPALPQLEGAAHQVYGESYDRAAIVRRYGGQLGYWSFYVKAASGPRPGGAALGPRRGPRHRDVQAAAPAL